MYIWNKDSLTKFYPFASISGVIGGFQEDEVILNFSAEKPAKVSLQYPGQRTLIMELLRLAYTCGSEHAKNDTVNSPSNVNFAISPVAEHHDSSSLEYLTAFTETAMVG